MFGGNEIYLLLARFLCVTAAVLAMASSSKLNSTTTSRIADALNEASALGLNGKDSDNLNELIAEYFGEDVASDSESEEEIEADEDEESTTPMNTDEDDDFVQQEDDNDHEWEDIEENEEPVNVDLAEGIVREEEEDFMSEDDKKEMDMIRGKKCPCKNPTAGLGCSHKFSDEYVFKMRYQINALPSDYKTMFLLGKIATGGIRHGRMTERSKQRQKERKLNRTMGYYVDGVQVCRETFLYMHV